MKKQKNKEAQKMAKLRWQKVSKKERTEYAFKMLEARRIKRLKQK